MGEVQLRILSRPNVFSSGQQRADRLRAVARLCRAVNDGAVSRVLSWAARLVPLIVIVTLAAAQPAHALRAGTPGISVEDTPLDVVLLVDESGSLSGADVKREIEAAGTIAQAPLNPRSRVTVVGFGGANGVAQNQDPTTVVCQPTVTSGPANLEYLARCVDKLHRRTAAEGNNTDYAAALSQAMSFLSPGTSVGQQSPSGATKAVLMLTDGGLYVQNDPQYPANWLPAAHHAVDIQLAAARAAGVEVWPLGFGTISAANEQYLQYLAAHGARAACDSRTASKPHAIVAQDSAKALNALYALYAAAGCIGTSSGGTTIVTGGQSRLLTVNIPAIASDGAITVNKSNPGVQVDFLSPDGTVITSGSLGGSTFQRSGQDTPVEVLHITNPQAGAWRIRLNAPSGLRSQLVSATAFWQGAVRVSIIASPPTARTSQRITVTLSVLSATGPITDRATLNGIHVGVSVAGDGLSGQVPIPLSQASGTKGGTLGVGDYHGAFTAPSKPGTLTFTGTAYGYGLHATEVPTEVTVGDAAALLQGTVEFSAPDSVLRGQSIGGHVLFNNQTGQTQKVRLTLSATPALATITAPKGEVTVPSGASTARFTIAVSRGSPLGPASLVVKVVDTSNLATVYGNDQLLVTVRKPPGWLAKYRWAIAGAVAILLLITLALYVRRLNRRRRVDVRGLFAVLSRDGEQVVHELKAPGRWAETFRFVIHDEESPQPRLDYPRPGDRAYVARRAANGRVSVKAPDGDRYDMPAGGAGERLPSGIHLALRDTGHHATSREADYLRGNPRSRWDNGSSASPRTQQPSQPAVDASDDWWQ